jgi:hypothetical protein
MAPTHASNKRGIECIEPAERKNATRKERRIEEQNKNFLFKLKDSKSSGGVAIEWTVPDTLQLEELMEEHGPNWEEIAKALHVSSAFLQRHKRSKFGNVKLFTAHRCEKQFNFLLYLEDEQPSIYAVVKRKGNVMMTNESNSSSSSSSSSISFSMKGIVFVQNEDENEEQSVENEVLLREKNAENDNEANTAAYLNLERRIRGTRDRISCMKISYKITGSAEEISVAWPAHDIRLLKELLEKHGGKDWRSFSEGIDNWNAIRKAFEKGRISHHLPSASQMKKQVSLFFSPACLYTFIISHTLSLFFFLFLLCARLFC